MEEKAVGKKYTKHHFQTPANATSIPASQYLQYVHKQTASFNITG